MKIESITIKNFQSYFGEETLEFSDGLNLIIGNGGKGKSKLFNAFYWALFGHIYITDLGWKQTRYFPESSNFLMQKYELINKRALFLAQEGEEVVTYVNIELRDDSGKLYQIERSVSAKRLSHSEWDNKKAWDVSPESLKVCFDGPNGTVPKADILAEQIISSIFPVGIRNYIWFQGESLDSLINLREKSTLEKAVQHISYYPYYQKLSQIISLSKTQIEDIERRKTRQANHNNAALNALITEIEALQRKINTEEKNLEKIESDILLIEASLAEDETKYSGFTKYTTLVANYKSLENEILRMTSEIEAYDRKQRELLPNLWILRGIDSMIEKSGEIIKDYNDEEVGTMPEKKYLDDPGRKRLLEILESGQCFVCGSKVEEGNDAYKWIKQRILDQEEYFREREEFESNMQFHKQFNIFFGKISEYPENLRVPLSSIDKQWKDSEEAIERIMAKRAKKQEAKNELDKKIEDIKKKLGVDPVKQIDEAVGIEGNIKMTRTNLDKQKNRRTTTKATIAGYKAELKAKEKEKEKLEQKDSTITKVVETEWKNISIFLEDVCKRVQEKARKELLRKIEERANEFYKKFTEHDQGYKGVVKIDDDYSIEFDAGLNTSHEDRKKMSIINALLSLNQEARDTYYPFISDAPTSSFDLETTYKYLLGIKDVFGQSIILTKDVDLESDKYTELLNQQKVSRIYNLTSNIYSGDEDIGQHEVSTKVVTLK